MSPSDDSIELTDVSAPRQHAAAATRSDNASTSPPPPPPHVRLMEAAAMGDSHDGASTKPNGAFPPDVVSIDDKQPSPRASPTSGESPIDPSAAKDTENNAQGTKQSSLHRLLHSIPVPIALAWIIPVLKDWGKIKPVLRSGLAAWICMVFLLIKPVMSVLGMASFLILVGIFIQPAEVPLAAVVEREFFTILMTCTGWAYSNLAIFFAHLARTRRLSAAETNTLLALRGEYIELAPTAICTTFLAIGVACTLYLKVKFGPSPFLFATILTCICLDIILIYAPLYPYPQYMLGKAIVLPLTIKSGVVILVSCVFFPKSVNSAFIERLLAVLQPLADGSQLLREEMKKSPLESDFKFDLMRDKVQVAEAGLLPLLGQSRLVARELSFSLASGEDLKSLVATVRKLLAPADGVAFYFTMIKSDLRGMDFQVNATQKRAHVTPSAFASRVTTPAHTRPASPQHSRPHTPTPSRPGTPHLDEAIQANTPAAAFTDGGGESSLHTGPRARHRFPSRLGGHHSVAGSIVSPSPIRHSFELRKRLYDLTHAQRHREHIDVGLWESIRYAAFESQYHGRANDHITVTCMRILADISADLLHEQAKAYADVSAWLQALNRQRMRRLRDMLTFRSTSVTKPLLCHADGSPKTLVETVDALQHAIEVFRRKKQLILEPFRASVEIASDSEEKWPHRYLFQCLTFCHFQVVYSRRLVDLLQDLENVEQRRRMWRLWAPKLPSLFHLETWRTHDGTTGEDHDEDPDEIPGMLSTLGKTRARDPDVMESEGRLQDAGIALSKFIHQLYRGNSLFMFKVALTTVLVSLPSVVRSSAGWAYNNKAIWVVIMSQLVAARHRGEALFGLFSRVIATFLGALAGLVIWYIASGSGIANPYAMAVVTAIAFPIVMLGRIHFPGPPITPIITCVTTALIVGYSWMDAHTDLPGSPGIGWDVAWRRFLEVIIGATAAYVVAILPPSSSMRTYYRLSHATAIRETGGLFCAAIYAAATPGAPHDSKEILDKLIAVRSKIRRLGVLKLSISYEWSLRGRWPMQRWETLERVELRILRLLTHAVTIYESLGPAYSRALLKRTHFLDPMFLSDCIAVLSMCTTSLSTGHPLPQIAPVLIDRYMSRAWGFKVREGDAHHRVTDTPPHTDEQDLGLPATVTFATLSDEQYQTFAVGASVAFGLTVHLDRLCVAVKSLVGEAYAVPADLQAYHPFTETANDWSSRDR